ncbi:hypothetical protein MHZ93_14445 [Roseomonas sp. ACRSG]|nr:hypothetical protein [Roseomonas sp. ACRSG]
MPWESFYEDELAQENAGCLLSYGIKHQHKYDVGEMSENWPLSWRVGRPTAAEIELRIVDFGVDLVDADFVGDELADVASLVIDDDFASVRA